MRKYGLKSVEADSLQIKEDEETLTVPAVITREGVYDYDGMLIYEPASEVEKAAFTALNAWVVEEHPPEIILSKPQLIRGTVENAKFDNGKIKADLVFFKNRCSPQYLKDIKTGKARSVSIGFFFDCVPQSGEFKGQHYNYVKKDILIDHVAVGNWQGRCSYPLCGIGVDTLKGADPYPNEHACRLREPEALNIVGSGERKHNGKTYRVIYGKPKDKPEAGSVEQAYRYPVKTWSEAEARKHCHDHGGNFEPAVGEEGDIANNGQEALTKNIKKQLEGYESADSLIAKINILVKQLNATV